MCRDGTKFVKVYSYTQKRNSLSSARATHRAGVVSCGVEDDSESAAGLPLRRQLACRERHLVERLQILDR